MTTASWQGAPPAAFDQIASIYDDVFTHSLIGRAQRKVVWESIDRIFHPGNHILEMNCGTGEDALHLAGRQIRVTACDASPAMIDVAQKKIGKVSGIDLHVLPNEFIGSVPHRRLFDGAFSNFSGLNCVADLSNVAHQLAGLIRSGGKVALCFSTRICLWEFCWYAVRGRFRTATRRWGGQVPSNINGAPVEVRYPTLRALRRAFEPWFRLTSVEGIGVAIPPSYAEGWARRHRPLFASLCHLEPFLSGVPLLRVTGDHMLVHLRRCA